MQRIANKRLLTWSTTFDDPHGDQVPRMAHSSQSVPTEVIYVRVRPEEKARLRAFADRAHNGSMAEAIRWLLDAYVATGSGQGFSKPQKHER